MNTSSLMLDQAGSWLYQFLRPFEVPLECKEFQDSKIGADLLELPAKEKG